MLGTAALTAPAAAEEVRILCQNILNYDNPGSSSYEALVRLVQANDPDIIMFQEAGDDTGRVAFQQMFQSEYPFRALSQAGGGGNREHVYSRWPLANPANLFAGGFSRPSLRVDVNQDPNNPGNELRLYCVHFKAGTSSSDAQLRIAMNERIRDDIDLLRQSDPDARIIIAGDLNDEPGDASLDLFLPPTFNLVHDDEQDPNTGSVQTRPASGRNLDHFVVSATVDAARIDDFVFNTLTFPAGTLPSPALPFDSTQASDHLTLIYDFDLIEFIPGDLNLDGIVSVGDIGPFVLALTDTPTYRAQFPAASLLEVGDINNDGVVSVSDIGPFVALLTGG